MSLLLDALKKAALEKHRRENPNAAQSPVTVQSSAAAQPSATAQSPASVEPALAVETYPQTNPSEPSVTQNILDRVAVIPAESVDYSIEFDEGLNKAYDDAHRAIKTSLDVGELHAEMLDLTVAKSVENAPQDTIDFTTAAQAENAITENKSTQNKSTENSIAEKNSELVFSIEEIDLEYAPKISAVDPQSKQDEASVSPQPPNTTQILDTQKHDNNSTPVNNHQPEPITANEVTAPAVESAPSKTPVESFNATSGKAALAQLLGHTRGVEQRARKRMFFMIGFLTVTTLIILLLYYFYLLQNSSSFSPRVLPATTSLPKPVTDNNLQHLSTASASASTKSSSEETSEASKLVKNSTGKNGRQTTVSTPDGVLSGEQKTETKTPSANATNSLENSAETHISLPANKVPKQAYGTYSETLKNPRDDNIERAYQAYQAGDMQAAEAGYRAALEQDQFDRDAMLGAAAVAVRQNRQQDALNLYQQRLTRDPKDEYAQAGIVALSSGGVANPQLESELNRLLHEFPNAAHLYFLKGSLYIEQQQWGAAQAALFEAWQRDNKNADVAYNLAITLDHLDQPKEAARFYHQALQLAHSHPVFSVESVQRRLQELEGSAP